MAWYNKMSVPFRRLLENLHIRSASEQSPPLRPSGSSHPEPRLPETVLVLPVHEHQPCDLVVNGLLDDRRVNLRWSNRTAELYVTSRLDDEPTQVLGHAPTREAAERLVEASVFELPEGGPDRRLEGLQALLRVGE